MSFPVPGLVFYGTWKYDHCFADDIFTSTVVLGLFGMLFHISLLKLGTEQATWHYLDQWRRNIQVYAYDLDKLKEEFV